MISSVQQTIDAIQFASAENSFGEQWERASEINKISPKQVNSIAKANNANHIFTEVSPHKATIYSSWVLDINSIHDHPIPFYTSNAIKTAALHVKHVVLDWDMQILPTNRIV